MIFDIYSIIGWVGGIFLILAYFLLSIRKLKSNSIIYHSLNFFGAIGLAISTFMTKSWPSMVLNIVWALIAIFPIYKKINTKPVYKELK